MRKEAPEYWTPRDGYGEEVRQALGVVLGNVADCLEAFGALVEAEAEGMDAEVERRLGESLEVAREARAILTELLLVDAQTQTSLWLLRGSILVAVEQILEPLQLEGRARLRREHTGYSAPRPRASPSVLMRDMVPSSSMRPLRLLMPIKESAGRRPRRPRSGHRLRRAFARTKTKRDKTTDV